MHEERSQKLMALLNNRNWISAHGPHSPLLPFFAHFFHMILIQPKVDYSKNSAYNDSLYYVINAQIFLFISWIELKNHFPGLINTLPVLQEGSEPPGNIPY